MNRFKTMGIAVVMAIALTALAGAGTASAAQFKAGAEPQTWSGSLSGKNHSLYVGEGIGCSGVAFAGETKTKTTGELTVTPELNCSYMGLPAGWKMNGCKYRFHSGPGASMVGTMDIVNCEKPMEFQLPTCTIEIGNQTGLGTVEYQNVGAGESVTITASLKGIKYTRNGSCWGVKGTFTDGEYSGQWTVKGTSKGSPSTVEVGIPTGPFAKFGLEEAPATIAGVDARVGSYKRITTAAGVLTCENFTLSGSSASTSPTSLVLTPSYKKCKFGSETIPDSNVSAGGCSYQLNANETFDIVGATCASSPITVTRAGCVVTIGPQSGLTSWSGLDYTEEGAGKTRSLFLPENSIEGVTHTATGASCVSQGVFSNGLIKIATKLTATNSKGAQQGLWVE